ncbi:hypothetical protein OESDEN_07083 [Oesophagostomum dentatum]|uniref:SCP domain-containing protein n=1 Tax=Oesophagostomum dentatum TaxID=61180 RepID=A0A0B1T6Z5_OESDE|nr:hypothetical protein OESDEN_07083 [Oesophagostomum dentatum]
MTAEFAALILLTKRGPVVDQWEGEMTDQLRYVVLAKVHSLRGNLAMGVVPNGKGGGFLRKANKLRQLHYSFDMERRAFRRARLGPFMGPPPIGVYENSFIIKDITISLDIAIQRSMQKWWSEITVREEPIDQIQNLWYDHLGISNWARMASEHTTDIGCGFHKYSGKGKVVCQFRSTLKEGSKLYTPGPTCNQCPGGKATCVNGLCPADLEGVC